LILTNESGHLKQTGQGLPDEWHVISAIRRRALSIQELLAQVFIGLRAYLMAKNNGFEALGSLKNTFRRPECLQKPLFWCFWGFV
jgi:hypothetical protein